MTAIAVPPTPQITLLRSHERSVPFRLDFGGDVAAGDTVQSAQVRVFARPVAQDEDSFAAQAGSEDQAQDVTSTLLMDQSVSGTAVTVLLGNGNATVGTQYDVRIVATFASGLTLQETITGITCDE